MIMDYTYWYAVYTRSRHEKHVAEILARRGVETYVPLRRDWSRRRDRKLTIEVPAMPGYLFVRCRLYAEVRAAIKSTLGVLRFVETAGRPCVIPEREIESLRVALANAANVEGHPYLRVGDRVRVVQGPLLGASGYLVRAAGS